MKKIIFLFLICFFCGFVYSQSNYEKGYIITLDNDTVYGQIDLKTNKVNATQCRFKPDGADDAVTYLPGEIKAYCVPEESKYYISHYIDMAQGKKPVFFEFLVNGIINLYNYEYNNVNYFIFENEEGKLEFVKIMQDKQKDDAGHVHWAQRTYEMIQDAKIKEAFMNYNPGIFNQKTMIEFTRLYHDEVCTTGEECIVYATEKPDNKGLRMNLALYTGIQRTSYTMDLGEGMHIKGNGSNLVGGLQAGILNDRFSRSFSIQYDLSFSGFNINSEELMLGYRDYASYECRGFFMLNKLGVRYTLVDSSFFCPVFEAGFAYGNLFAKSFDLVHNEVRDGMMYFGVRTPRDEIRNRAIGFYLSAGCDFRLKNRQAIILRVSYEKYSEKDNMQIAGHDYFGTWGVKAGYSFSIF